MYQPLCQLPLPLTNKDALTLYRITFYPMQKCSFSLAFTPYLYSFGAVQVQNCSSFLAGTKLYLIAGTKLYRIAGTKLYRIAGTKLYRIAGTKLYRIAGTKLYRIAGTKLYRIALSNVNAWLIRNTYPYRIKKVIWYSVNAAKKNCEALPISLRIQFIGSPMQRSEVFSGDYIFMRGFPYSLIVSLTRMCS